MNVFQIVALSAVGGESASKTYRPYLNEDEPESNRLLTQLGSRLWP